MRCFSLFVAGFWCMAVSSPALAHHAVSAKFDIDQTVTLAGAVTQVDWSNPHAHVFLNVGPVDNFVNWAIELESPVDMERAGWTSESLAIGTVVSVEGSPARDGSRQVWANAIVVDATGDEVLTGRPSVPALANDSGPTPRWGDGQVRLSPDPGGRGFWAAPSATALVQEGIDVEMDAHGLLADLSDASEVAPFQPWALALYRDRQENFLRDDPAFLHCLPPGGPRQFMSPYGVQFIEDRTNQRIFVLLGSGNHNWRLIYMDGREQVGAQSGDADNPLYYGRSVGRWEGDTLVVDSVSFNERFWFSNGGLPHTDRLHLVERFTRSDYDTLEYHVTIEDTEAYTRPWTSRWTLRLVRDETLPEYYCEENRP